MQNQQLEPSYRAVLFSQLATADANQQELDRLFQLLDDGRRAASRAQLTELAERFAGGQSALIEALRETGHFLEWELEFVRLGLAAGDATAAYRYLSAHYARIGACLHQIQLRTRLPLIALGVVGVGLPLLGWLEGGVSAGVSIALAVVPLLVVIASTALIYGRVQRGRLLDSAHSHAPGLGRVLARQQSLHFFTGLEICLHKGLSLAQALPLVVAALPASPQRAVFERVHQQVAEGGRLSEALRQSGALEGVVIRGVPAGASIMQGAALAQQVLTESMRLAVEEGQAQAGQWLPQLILVGMGLLLVANFIAMGLR